MSLGSQIKKYRDAAGGMTYATLEELSGVGTASLNALEKRNSKRSEHAPAIARAFGLTVDQLLDEDTDYSEHVRQHTSQKPQGYPAAQSGPYPVVSEPWPSTYWPFNVGRERVRATLTHDDLERVDAYILALVQARENELVKNSPSVSNGHSRL